MFLVKALRGGTVEGYSGAPVMAAGAGAKINLKRSTRKLHSHVEEGMVRARPGA